MVKHVLSATVLAAVLSSSPANADYQFIPAFGEVAGPSKAKGVVIWSHGLACRGCKDASLVPNPVYLEALREAGWDVIRFNRTRDVEKEGEPVVLLAVEARKLREQGYKKVVLAGQSAGAWDSLKVSAFTQVDAVIAIAPAYYGTNENGNHQFSLNASELFDLLGKVHQGHVLLAYWPNDWYEPGNRTAESDSILTSNNVPHLIIDHPEGTSGHSFGNGKPFAVRFGQCVVAFADGQIPSMNNCDNGG